MSKISHHIGYTRSAVDALIADFLSSAAIAALYYNKTEIDTNIYTQAEVDALVAAFLSAAEVEEYAGADAGMDAINSGHKAFGDSATLDPGDVDRAFYSRISPARAYTFNKLVWRVLTQAGDVSWAWLSLGATQLDRQATTGAFGCPAAGEISTTLGTTWDIPPGAPAWVGWSNDNASVRILGHSIEEQLVGLVHNGELANDFTNLVQLIRGVAHPVPATVTGSVGPEHDATPAFALLEQ